MATTMRQAVKKAAKRTQSLAEQLREAAEVERKLVIDAEAAENPKFREVEKALAQLRHELHMGRLRVSRKEFAIKVRNRRLRELPKEIKKIESEKHTEENGVASMAEREATLLAQMDAIRAAIAQRLETELKAALPVAG